MTFAISMSLINLGLYCMQQLGMTLAVGAEAILLVAYLQAVRDGVVDEEEKGFARAVRSVKDFGLFFIIISGGAIVANQFLTGQLSQFLSIVVLFKWSLIGIALFLTFVRGSGLFTGLMQGLSAGTWFALFAVHILAPEAPWMQLVTFYGIWLLGFSICWTVLVFSLRNRKTPIAAQGAYSAGAKPKAAVVITPNRVNPAIKPMQPAAVGNIVPQSGLASASAPSPVAPPVTVTMPKPPPPAQVAAIPVPPPPAPSSTATPVPMPPTPPRAPLTPPSPPPKVTLGTAPAEWLHVMPRTPEDLAKRNQS